MPHSFKYYRPDEIEGIDAARLAHLALVDKALDMTEIDPPILEAMSDDELRAIIDPRATPAQPAPSPLRSIAPAPHLQQPERVPLTARQLGLPSYPAKVWDSQLRRMVHIGVFRTMVDRDQAIAAAKQRRSMGLPVKPIGPTNGH